MSRRPRRRGRRARDEETAGERQHRADVVSFHAQDSSSFARPASLSAWTKNSCHHACGPELARRSLASVRVAHAGPRARLLRGRAAVVIPSPVAHDRVEGSRVARPPRARGFRHDPRKVRRRARPRFGARPPADSPRAQRERPPSRPHRAAHVPARVRPRRRRAEARGGSRVLPPGRDPPRWIDSSDGSRAAG